MFEEILKREEIKNTYTLKLYPYLKDKINRTTKRLDKILFEYFDYDDINESLFGEYRHSNIGFNHSLAIEFMIELIDLLLSSKEDIRSIVVPEIRHFLDKKKKVEIVDKEKNIT